jgi:hypothetical protein
MGRLEFSAVEVKVLTNDLALVLGRWRVIKSETSSQGLFTLLMGRFSGEWKIIHDHSSSQDQ